jgi:hypothetical protein
MGVTAMTQRKRAVLLSKGTGLKRRKSLALFAASGEFPVVPLSGAAKRAEWTPGVPAKASTSKPLSSAKHQKLTARAAESDRSSSSPRFEASIRSRGFAANQRANPSDFFVALPAKLSVSSITSGAPGKLFKLRQQKPVERTD